MNKGVSIEPKNLLIIVAQVVLFSLSLSAYGENDYQIMLVYVVLSIFVNLVFCIFKIKQRFILLLFVLTIFLFLVGRPYVEMIRKDNWWSVSSSEGIKNALLSIQLVLSVLPVGGMTAKETNNIREGVLIEERTITIGKIRMAALIIFILGLLGGVVDGFQKMSYMTSHSYVEYYSEYTTSTPFVFKAFVRLLKPAMCLYLATFPKKKMTIFVLISYILTTIPYIVVGMRSPTLLACLFSLSYFLLREFRYPNQERWVGKKEIIILLLAIPSLAIFAYSYNFIRQGKAYTIDNKVFLNFIHQQGISFQYLAQGFDVLDELPVKGLPGYMLGPLFDNIVYGTAIGRMIFNTKAIATQSMEAISVGHDMKQHLSYALMGNGYFLGYGSGAIFILEVIHDIGWLGLLVYSFFMGWFCVKIVDWFLSPKLIGNTIIIYSLLQIYYIARSDALSFLEHIINPYFWIAMIIIYTLSYFTPSFKVKLAVMR